MALRASLTTAQPDLLGDARLLGLVLCKKHNIGTWRTEIALRYPTVEVLSDTISLDTIEKLYDRGHGLHRTVLLLSWQSLGRKVDRILAFLKKHMPLSIIADESTAIKNSTTSTAAAAHKVAQATAGHQVLRLALVGEPAPEKPEELWSQFQFCWPERNPLGRTYYAFLRKWFIRHDHGYSLLLETRDQFYELVRRNLIELTLEELAIWRSAMGIQKVHHAVEIYEPSSEQAELLNYLLTHWALPLEESSHEEGSDLEMQDTMAISQKMQQIASGFYYDREKRPLFLKHNPKLVLLLDLLERLLKFDPNRQIVIWQQFRAEVPMLLRGIELLIGKGIVSVGTDPEQLALFRSRQTRIALAPATKTQGLNELVGADVNIFFSSPWSSELREQALARLERLGQRSTVVTHIDVCSSELIDRRIVEALQAKSLDPARLHAFINDEATRRRQRGS